MAKMTVYGIDVFQKNMQTLDHEARNICKGGLGEGAGYAAEVLREAVEMLPIRPSKTSKEDHERALYGVTESEYAQILNNFGIAKFRDSGGAWNTSVGFGGYVSTPSPMWHNRVPTGYLVQVVEYGTVDADGKHFRRPTHMISGAINRSKDEIAQQIQNYIDKEVNKIMN